MSAEKWGILGEAFDQSTVALGKNWFSGNIFTTD